MKSKEEIKKLAQQIVKLELQAQKFSQQFKDKELQSTLSNIENIMGSLSFSECLELNEQVIKKLENN